MAKPNIQAIVAVDENWGIGKNGNLLVHIPDDLANFKKMTTGNCVIMGRKTLESLPGKKGLPDRSNIVLTRDKAFTAENVLVMHSKEEVLEYIHGLDKKTIHPPIYCDIHVPTFYIIGGGEIYRQFLDECSYIHVTRINKTFDADTFFPNLSQDPKWDLEVETDDIQYKDLTYRFQTYKNISH